LDILKSTLLNLPEKYPPTVFSFGAGISQAKEQISIICSNIDDTSTL
jgi:hypothetical protein